jgi:hypothetical protein
MTTVETNEHNRKNPAAVALGRLGGKKGGKARARKLSAARRSEIARNAALARARKLTPEMRSAIAKKAGSSPKKSS